MNDSTDILKDRLNGFLKDLSTHKIQLKPVRFNDAHAVENELPTSDYIEGASLDHPELPSINRPGVESPTKDFDGRYNPKR